MKRLMKISSPVREVKSFALCREHPDSVLYMGKIFAILCPKRSIASRFRGTSLQASEPQQK